MHVWSHDRANLLNLADAGRQQASDPEPPIRLFGAIAAAAIGKMGREGAQP